MPRTPSNPAVVQAELGIAIAQTGIDPVTGGPPESRITALGNLGGIYPVSQRLGAYSVRFDRELAPAHRLSARFNYAHDRPSALEAQNKDQIAGLLSYGRTASLTTIDPTLVLSLSSTLGADKVNEAPFSWARRQLEMNTKSIDTPVNIPGLRVPWPGTDPAAHPERAPLAY